VFSKLSGPAWLSVSSTGGLSGTPTNEHVGLNAFTVQVTDGTVTASATLNLTVANTNDAPTFAADPIVLAATEDTAFSGQLSASDPDTTDSLVFSKLSGPAWLTVSSTGGLSGTPINEHVGLNAFTVQVTDGSVNVSATLNLTVADINHDVNGNGMLDDWEIGKFGNAAPGANPPDGDLDRDGLTNLMEFALDTHPLVPSANPVSYDIETVGGEKFLRLTVPKNPAASNLTFLIESTAALDQWSADHTVIETNTNLQLIVRDDVAIGSANRRFIRLKVSANP
jgi:hypothetical protein